MMRHATSLAIAALGLAATAAGADIDFDGIPAGTAIDGLSIGLADFAFDFDDPGAATIETEGGPDPSPFGEAPYVLGPADGAVEIDFAVPVAAVAYGFVINDTVMSSAGSLLEAFDGAGKPVGSASSPYLDGPTFWPGTKSAGGSVSLSGVGPIGRVRISFVNLVFADMFALDNISLTISGDANGDDVVDVDDLVTVITNWGTCPPESEPCPADLDADGTVGVDDLITVIVSWSG